MLKVIKLYDNVGHHHSLTICDFAKTVREEGVGSMTLVRFVKLNDRRRKTKGIPTNPFYRDTHL